MFFKSGLDILRGKKKNSRIKQHPNRVSQAESMKPFVDWILAYTDLKPEIVFEIGANYAQDAEGLRYFLDLPEENIWVFEAHPDICSEIAKMYNFNIFNNAVFNKEKEMIFNVVDLTTTANAGISSLYKHQYWDEKMKQVKVKAICMDNFMKLHKIEKIDFLKLDVEGCNFEVLEGFGNRLKDVQAIHVEAEHEPLWQGQKLYDDIEKILKNNGFDLIIFNRYYTQSDSLWLQKKWLKNEFKKR